jgi:hypothetical protein
MALLFSAITHAVAMTLIDPGVTPASPIIRYYGHLSS